jgi:transcriptional antiterminator RfaH
MEAASSRMTEATHRATEEGALSPAEPAWFCIRTHMKREHIAAAHLRRLPGVDVFHPQVRLLRSTRRGRHWSTESLFPNYLFAHFDLEAMLARVTYTPSVKIVLRFGDRVPAIPDRVIKDLRRGLDHLADCVLTDAPIEGEEIEIASGPFAGMKGLVTRVQPGKERAKILLNVMGRSVPAELSLDLVLYSRKHAANFALSPAHSEFVHAPSMSDIRAA